MRPSVLYIYIYIYIYIWRLPPGAPRCPLLPSPLLSLPPLLPPPPITSPPTLLLCPHLCLSLSLPLLSHPRLSLVHSSPYLCTHVPRPRHAAREAVAGTDAGPCATTAPSGRPPSAPSGRPPSAPSGRHDGAIRPPPRRAPSAVHPRRRPDARRPRRQAMCAVMARNLPSAQPTSHVRATSRHARKQTMHDLSWAPTPRFRGGRRGTSSSSSYTYSWRRRQAWHLFVMAASAAHWWSVVAYVLPCPLPPAALSES
jgi:predicted membrane channel-forming protein YqfA (hemolysin III family)